MNILLLTNHLKNYAGSEIQILEIYKYFKSQNHKVSVYANLIGEPISCHFAAEDLYSDIQDIYLPNYQLIWSQHGIFSRFFEHQNFPELIALIFSVHLSPFENMELLQIPYMQAIGAHFIANSPETAERLRQLGVSSKTIHISYNCAPAAFQTRTQAPEQLTRLAVVSNHPPEELREAAALLRKEKYQVDWIGQNSKKHYLITPERLALYDGVITIGKTVQYALLGNKAVYCYDHFGGPGYLSAENYLVARDKNFSGRGFGKKEARMIAEEVIQGFEANRHFVSTLTDRQNYLLEHFMSRLLALLPQKIYTEQQNLIKQFVPIEQRISQFYLESINSQTALEAAWEKHRRCRRRERISWLITACLLLLLAYLANY